MEFNVEKYITPFISSQFPDFYEEEGPNFILFMKSYYEWMQDEGNVIGESRSLLDYRDIDNTIESFLEHFQKKYLYGIPFNVIINKRYLLKHILDVYRSKSSIQCYKLLFKLIYNEDVDIYLPGRDILRISDGTWTQPKYLEVSDTSVLPSYIGSKIYGLSSGTSAIVESYTKEPINQNIISTLNISNILPKGGTFIQREKIVRENHTTVTDISMAPVVLGSLSCINITNGGQSLNIGDFVKIVHRDISNNSVISFGTNGILKVTNVFRGFGSITFSVISGGFGFTANSLVFTYKSLSETTGNGASFALGALSFTENITYNTDIIADRANITLDSATYNYSGNSSANLTSTLQQSFSYSNNVFGTISSLTNIVTGNRYTQQVNNFVRSTLISNNISGNVSYTTTSANVTGTGTTFTSYLSNNDVVALIANTSNTMTQEYHIIRQVANDTVLVLFDLPTYNSTASAAYKLAPVILQSNFAPYETPRISDPKNGINDNIAGYPSIGSSVVTSLRATNSGKGYADGENVSLYLYSGLNTPTVINGGVNYSNGDILVIINGDTSSSANGFVTTNANGTITSVTLNSQGSGYNLIPTIRVKSTNGIGAVLTASLTEFNTFSKLQGTVVKTGVGVSPGHWTTTRGFLNSDKYIQDSYFYQDFSYQIKTAVMLNKYRDILYNTFHTSGSELFGIFYYITNESSNSSILYEQTAAILG